MSKSPIGNFPELNAMYESSFKEPLSNAQTNVKAQDAATTLAQQRAAESEANSRARAFSNKKNYTIVGKDDGGYAFYGPDGKEVTAATYANNTNQDLTHVLKDSQNPIDQRYIQDQKDLHTYLQAKTKSSFDTKQKAIAHKYEGLVKQEHGLDLSGISPMQAVQALQDNYPTIYGANQLNQPGISGDKLLLPTQEQVVGGLGGSSKLNKQYSSTSGRVGDL